MNINLHHLMYFKAVVDAGSVSAAARRLKVSQPTISVQLRQLADALGIGLFERRGSKLELTEEARVVLDYSERISTLVDELSARVTGGNLTEISRFRVGSADAVPKLLVQRILEGVFKQFPEMQVLCTEGTLRHLLEQLSRHELDVVIADSPLPLGVSPKFHQEVVIDSPVAWFGKSQRSEPTSRSLVQRLGSHTLILPSAQAGLRSRVDAWLRAQKIAPKRVHECDDRALIEALAVQGVGVFPAASLLAAQYKERLQLLSWGEVTAIRERVFVITRDQARPHPALAQVGTH